MELTYLYRMSDGRLAMEIAFVNGITTIDQWANKFVERFNGKIETMHLSNESSCLKILLLNKGFHLVRATRIGKWLVSGGRTWLVPRNINSNEVLMELEDEIQCSLGRVGGYDQRWPVRKNNITKINKEDEDSILEICKKDV